MLESGHRSWSNLQKLQELLDHLLSLELQMLKLVRQNQREKLVLVSRHLLQHASVPEHHHQIVELWPVLLRNEDTEELGLDVWDACKIKSGIGVPG